MSEAVHERWMTGSGRELARGFDEDNSYKPFHSDSTPTRYSRDRVVDIRHITIEVGFDIPAKRLVGTASLKVTPIDEGVRELVLDGCDMDFGTVTVDGQPAAIRYDGAKLKIDFAKPLDPDREVTLRIPYRVTNPRAGIYFVGPDEHYPDKPVEIWTQGQDEDSRYWFPCFDYPNQKATSEVIVTVPKRFETLSNGILVKVTEVGDDKTFHWRHDTPHVAYLVTLVVGEFVEVHDQWDGIPVHYYHHPGDEDRARNSFADTPKMVEFFSHRIGVRYPYARYSQIPVTDFVFGGMENTTATTQTAYTLHDDRAHLDFTSNPLVSHELAHSWFGNLITCRDWSHGWLNEGFTTYMECCWEQHEHGDEHFQYYLLGEMERYIDEDRDHYRRPLVCNRYEEPIELFDRHLYEKGACVQHLLRFTLGERLFWKALRLYTERHAGKCVVTADWAGAIEDATGRNVDEFFDQWVHGAGYPEIKLGFDYDPARKLATLSVEQTQTRDDLTPIFKTPVRVAFTRLAQEDQPERREEQTLILERGQQQFNLPSDFEPNYLTFDVGNWILKTLDLSGLSETMLIDQLSHDSDVVGRVHAARELGKRATRRAIEALGETLATDAPWFLQAEIAKALGSIGADAALDALLVNGNTPHPKARRGVVKALGEFRHEPKAAEALLAILRDGDASYFVEAEACESLGRVRDRRAKQALHEAIEKKESFNEVIRIGALKGLVALEDPSALAKIEESCRRGVPNRLRFNAMTKLGALAKLADEAERTRVRKLLEDALEEPDFFVSLGTIAGLKELADVHAVTALRRKERIAVDGRVKARARKAANFLTGKQSGSQQVKRLRDELQEIRKQNRKLLDRVGKLEAMSEASPD